jgi:hypothetical protein
MAIFDLSECRRNRSSVCARAGSDRTGVVGVYRGRGCRAVSHERQPSSEPFRRATRARAPGGRLSQSVSRRPPRQATRRSGVQRRSMATTGGGSSTNSADSILWVILRVIGTRLLDQKGRRKDGLRPHDPVVTMERPAPIRSIVGYAASWSTAQRRATCEGAGHEQRTIYWSRCPC